MKSYIRTLICKADKKHGAILGETEIENQK